MLQTPEFTSAGCNHVSAMAQEREFYKYYQLPQRQGLLNQPPITPSKEVPEERVPQSSHDTTLTALAQLGALRLNVQRCMISLFDRHTQYILAEATRTLSLQDDRVHVDGDALWLGSSVIKKEDGICHYVCETPELNAGQETSVGTDFALVIPDMTLDHRTSQRNYVVNAPHLRFFAGVPILSRRGIAIGAFSVSDGETRSGLDALELRFMKDTAEAIMNYLEMKRSQQQNRRGASMIAGLGNFADGHTFSSLNLRPKKAINTDETEDPDSNPVKSNWRRYSQGVCTPPKNDTARKDGALSSSSTSTQEGRRSESSLARNERFRNKSLSSGTKDIFGRAAHVLRQSLEVEGVKFFDASVRSYGSLVRNSDDHHSEVSTGSGEGDSSSDSENLTTAHSSTETEDSAACEVLGSSTIDNDQVAPGTMHESLLRSLLGHYPSGGVFNIDENGWVSSSEGSDSAPGNTVSREIIYRRHEAYHTQQRWAQKKRQKFSLRDESKALVKVFPQARSVILFPLWDSRRNRWFSGLFVWTNTPRVFSLKSELAYLYAFTNSVMAEIHRLDVELANKANRTLVSSISHELRSPLHGILGSTDLLRDSTMTPPQQTLVQTIEHCGRSLLDIINNMLDFAKINQFTRKSRSSRFKTEYSARRRPAMPGRARSKSKPSHGIINLISDVQLDAVLEEVVNTVFAGHCFSTMSGIHPPGSSAIPDLDKTGDCLMDDASNRIILGEHGPLTVIYDVEPGVDWFFETQAGVWRRILMNLFGNSLKYTRSGYILVSLKPSALIPGNKARKGSRGELSKHSMAGITLTVKDTGQGIDREYLKSNIFKPFSQEDSLSPGSGLGLSIVHQTVLSMGGKIDITSTKGVGTEVTISMDLPRTPNTPSERDTPAVDTVKESASGKSIGFIGLDSAKEDDEALSLLGSSLRNMCQDHLGMEVASVPVASIGDQPHDMYLVRQSDFTEVDRTWKTISAAARGHALVSASPPMIVICSTPEMAQKLSANASQSPSFPIYEFITQPCGPGKMASAVMACINRRQEQRSQSQATMMDAEDQLARSVQGMVLDASRNSQNGRTETVSCVDLSLSPPKSTVSATTTSVDPTNEIPMTETTPKQPAVLLVDDNDVNLKLLVAFMKKAKYPYFTAQNGLEALEVFKANSEQIHIILMDISMPVMDGLESTREIRLFEKLRSDKNTANCQPYHPATVIALSGLGSAVVRQEAFNSGVDLFLSKPVRFQELIKQIKEIGLEGSG